MRLRNVTRDAFAKFIRCNPDLIDEAVIGTTIAAMQFFDPANPSLVIASAIYREGVGGGACSRNYSIMENI